MAYSITLARVVENNQEYLDAYQVLDEQHYIWAKSGYSFVQSQTLYLKSNTVPECLKWLQAGMTTYREEHSGQRDFVKEAAGSDFDQMTFLAGSLSSDVGASIIRLALL